MAPTLHHPSSGPAGAGVTPAPVTDAEAALAVVRLAASDPPRAETVVLFLDDAHVGRACCIVSGTTAPDDVFDVGALAAEAAGRSPDIHAVVLATMRAGEAPGASAAGPLEDDAAREHDRGPEDDVARWRALLELFDEVGVELLDWFVIRPGVRVLSLRAFTGMPSQWRGT
jgi:hypothetical protein